MQEIEKFYTSLTREIKDYILAEEDLFILNTSTKQLLVYFCNHKVLIPLEIDTERTISSKIVSKVDTRLRKNYNIQALLEKKPDNEIETLIIEIPLKQIASNSILFPMLKSPDEGIKLLADSIQVSIITKENSIIKGTTLIADETKKWKGVAFEWIKSIQQITAQYIQRLHTDIEFFIEQRKKTLSAKKQRHDDIIKTINIPLKSKEDDVIKKIRLSETPLVQRVRPSQKDKEDYVLDRSKVLDIIHVLDNQGRQFEKTPSSYKALGEDDLRNILLVNLNSIFEIKAVGEAFSNVGRADITLAIDSGNILIIECKIWDGVKKHLAAISQLISYLTWRRNYGIVINFFRSKDMSKAIKTASDEVKNHPTYMRIGKTSLPTHFSTIHQSPSDTDRLIEIHHVFYNLYTPEK